jgi:aspartate aminotransferase-like enzyme
MPMSDPRPIDAAKYAETERRLGALLDTERDVLIMQGEAILLLEAAARGLGGPGVRALNLVSGPYGEALGDWLAVGGAQVEHLAVEFDRALSVDAVQQMLGRTKFDVVSVVHAEAATGVVNPLPEIAAAAHDAGALVLVDAVASVGAEPLPIDELDLDLTMIGTQKTMSGPNGVCALIANDRGWGAIAANPNAPRDSSLSLLDWKQRWIDTDRKNLYGYAYQEEMRALISTLDELDGDTGLASLVERHQRAAVASRLGALALGLEPWVEDAAQGAGVVTLVRPPAGVSVAEVAAAAAPYLEGGRTGLIGPAPGPLAEAALRINHTGAGAYPEPVLASITALAGALRQFGHGVRLDLALSVAERALFES